MRLVRQIRNRGRMPSRSHYSRRQGRKDRSQQPANGLHPVQPGERGKNACPRCRQEMAARTRPVIIIHQRSHSHGHHRNRRENGKHWRPRRHRQKRYPPGHPQPLPARRFGLNRLQRPTRLQRPQLPRLLPQANHHRQAMQTSSTLCPYCHRRPGRTRRYPTSESRQALSLPHRRVRERTPRHRARSELPIQLPIERPMRTKGASITAWG